METNSYEMFVKAFQIFAKYEPDKGFSIETGHDVLYAAETLPSLMDKKDVEKLEGWGWSYSEGVGRWEIFT